MRFRSPILLLLAACGSSSDVTPAPAADAAVDPCVARCVQERQMEARAIEDITADCRRECTKEQ